MTHRLLWHRCSIAVLVFCAAASAAETLENVEKTIAEQLAKHKTLQTKSKVTTDMNTPDVMMKTDSEVVSQYSRRPENKWVSRVEAKTHTVRKLKDQPEEKEDGTILTIADGEFLWMLSQSGDNKSAMKNKLDPKTAMGPFDAKVMFEMLHQHFDLKLLPEEKIDGKEAYVIEARPKDTDVAKMMARSVTHYDKKTGIALRAVSYDKDDKVVTSMTVSDIKIDEDIPADRFVFKAPPGVEVVDLTQMQQQTSADESAQSKPSDNASNSNTSKGSGESQAKTEPKKEEKKDDKKKDALKGLFKGLGK